jgi:hypothetical protein
MIPKTKQKIRGYPFAHADRVCPEKLCSQWIKKVSSLQNHTPEKREEVVLLSMLCFPKEAISSWVRKGLCTSLSGPPNMVSGSEASALPLPGELSEASYRPSDC